MYFCPFCPQFYCYEQRLVIGFHLDEMKKLLKHGEKMTLDKCFELYLQQKKINCRLCKCYEALCHEKIYSTTKVLIIAFKRKNHTYKGDIDFNLHFSMSNYVNQKENIYKKIIN